jgi:cytochrome P450
MSVQTKSRPPGPHGRNLLDNLQVLRRDPLEFLVNTIRDYGDYAQLGLRIMDVHILNHPDLIRYVLVENHHNYSKDTFQYNLLAGITGDGLLTNNGDTWLRQRRLAQPAFNRSRLASIVPLAAAATSRMLDRWSEFACQGQPVDVDAEMMQLALEIVGHALFSVDLSADAPALTRSTLTALDHLVYRSRNPFSLPPPLPTARNRRYAAAVSELDNAVNLIIHQRQELLKLNPARQPSDLLDMLMLARDEQTGAAMDERQLRSEVITLLIAGHETVASALTWAWYLLAKNPEVGNRLHQESRQVLSGRVPEFPDLANLPYTLSVFEEALRLYPPAWIITRKALKADAFAGFPVRPNSLVVISPYTIHRHPDYWTDPLRFDPQRFLADKCQPEAGERPRFSFIPFGGGPRICIGDGFARVEAQVILAMVAGRYRLELLPGPEPAIEALVTLRPQHGLKMLLK